MSQDQPTDPNFDGEWVAGIGWEVRPDASQGGFEGVYVNFRFGRTQHSCPGFPRSPHRRSS